MHYPFSDALEDAINRTEEFVKKRGWDLKVDKQGREKDEYDTLESVVYVCALKKEAGAVGSFRVVPTAERYMIRDHLSDFVFEPDELPRNAKVCEISRVYNKDLDGSSGLSSPALNKLFVAMLELGIKKRGGILKKLGPVHEIMGRRYVIGFLPV